MQIIPFWSFVYVCLQEHQRVIITKNAHLRGDNFLNFLGRHSPRLPIVLACFTCLCALHTMRVHKIFQLTPHQWWWEIWLCNLCPPFRSLDLPLVYVCVCVCVCVRACVRACVCVIIQFWLKLWKFKATNIILYDCMSIIRYTSDTDAFFMSIPNSRDWHEKMATKFFTL